MVIIPKKIDIDNSNKVQTVLLFGLFVMFAITSLIGVSLLLIFSENIENNGFNSDVFSLSQVGLLIFAGLMIFYPTTLIYQLVNHFGIRAKINSKISSNQKYNNRLQKLNNNGSFLNATTRTTTTTKTNTSTRS